MAGHWQGGAGKFIDLAIACSMLIRLQYSLEITNTTMAPDGFERMVYAVNGQIPGPVITADWGDTLQITVKNSMQDNG